jgi:Glycosyl hydrolase family 47
MFLKMRVRYIVLTTLTILIIYSLYGRDYEGLESESLHHHDPPPASQPAHPPSINKQTEISTEDDQPSQDMLLEGSNESLKEANLVKPVHAEEHFPVVDLHQLPLGTPKTIPKIQHEPRPESADALALRGKRLGAVKAAFKHAWKGYKDKAWGADELTPISGTSRTAFSGWAATLVDSLDSLWIMGLDEEFREAVKFVGTIDFSKPKGEMVNVFETTIRYLGGLLGAYELSGGRGEYKVLLEKAVELGDFLMGAFDTENRMPMCRWHW